MYELKILFTQRPCIPKALDDIAQNSSSAFGAYNHFVCCTAALHETKRIYTHAGRAYSLFICCKAAVHIDSATVYQHHTWAIMEAFSDTEIYFPQYKIKSETIENYNNSRSSVTYRLIIDFTCNRISLVSKSID